MINGILKTERISLVYKLPKSEIFAFVYTGKNIKIMNDFDRLKGFPAGGSLKIPLPMNTFNDHSTMPCAVLARGKS